MRVSRVLYEIEVFVAFTGAAVSNDVLLQIAPFVKQLSDKDVFGLDVVKRSITANHLISKLLEGVFGLVVKLRSYLLASVALSQFVIKNVLKARSVGVQH